MIYGSPYYQLSGWMTNCLCLIYSKYHSSKWFIDCNFLVLTLLKMHWTSCSQVNNSVLVSGGATNQPINQSTHTLYPVKGERRKRCKLREKNQWFLLQKPSIATGFNIPASGNHPFPHWLMSRPSRWKHHLWSHENYSKWAGEVQRRTSLFVENLFYQTYLIFVTSITYI